MLAALLPANSAGAQMAVIDPANLAQTVLIAQRTQRHLEELQDQFRIDSANVARAGGPRPIPVPLDRRRVAQPAAMAVRRILAAGPELG